MVAVATSRVFKSHKWRDALLFQRAHVTPERSERTADVGLNEWGAVVVTPLMKMLQRVGGSTLSRSNWRLLKVLRGALDFCLRRRYVDRGFAISMFTCLSPPCTQREREKERHVTGRSRLSTLAEGKKKKLTHFPSVPACKYQPGVCPTGACVARKYLSLSLGCWQTLFFFI